MLLLGPLLVFFLSILSPSLVSTLPVPTTDNPDVTTEDATNDGLIDRVDGIKQEILKKLQGFEKQKVTEVVKGKSCDLECKEAGDDRLKDRVTYFAAEKPGCTSSGTPRRSCCHLPNQNNTTCAATTLGLCLVISFCMVVNGLMWQRCTYVPAHLQRNGRRQSQSNNYQPVPQREPKAPGNYGYGGPGFGADWGFGDGAQDGIEEDSEVYYSIPFEEYATPADALPERNANQGAEAEKGTDEEGIDDVEIEDNDLYNVGGDAPAAKDGDDVEIEDNDVYNIQAGNDEVHEASSEIDQAPEDSEHSQAERWKDRKDSHVQMRVSEIERATEIKRQMSVPEAKRQLTNATTTSQELPHPPEDIIQSLAVALKERQEQLEQQKLNQNQSNANNTCETPYADDDEELYSNMEACHTQQGSEETQREADANQEAATNYTEESVQNPALYQDDEELYCNTNCGRYDEEPLYGNI